MRFIGSKLGKIIFFLIMVIFVSNSNAAEVKICGVEWPPFTKGKTIQEGISSEIYREIFQRRLGFKLIIRAMPWARCLSEVKKGNFDAVSDNLSTSDFINGKYAHSVYALAMYVNQDSTEKTFKGLNSLIGKKVGMVRGYGYTPKIKEFKGWKVHLAVKDEHLIKMLDEGRLDYIINDIFSAPIMAEKFKIKIRAIFPLVDSTPLYLAFNKEKEELAKQYDEELGKLIKEGMVDKIYKNNSSIPYVDISKYMN